jgi:hypothetical protein
LADFLRCSLLASAAANGSYSRSLRSAFLPELLSMNFLMAGMIPVMTMRYFSPPALTRDVLVYSER